MKKANDEKIKSTEIKLIAAFLLVSGVIGFANFLFRIAALDNAFETIIYLIAAAIFGLAAYSGFQLLKENEKGLEIARAIVAIQIVSFHIAGLGYAFVTGGYLFVGITNAKIGFNFGLETNLLITLADESSNFVLRLNLLAIIAFMYLSRLLKQVENDNDILDAVSRQNEESRNP